MGGVLFIPSLHSIFYKSVDMDYFALLTINYNLHGCKIAPIE